MALVPLGSVLGMEGFEWYQFSVRTVPLPKRLNFFHVSAQFQHRGTLADLVSENRNCL